MGLPFLNSKSKRIDQLVAIDLGSRSTKAVHLVRHGDGYELTAFAIDNAPKAEQSPTPGVLGEHLKTVHAGLGAKTRNIVLAVGVHNCLFRTAEMPFLPLPDLRNMLKYGSRNYLQEELKDYTFDCHLMPFKAPLATDEKAPTVPQKQKVLVGGLTRQRLEDLTQAAKIAGLNLLGVVPGHIGPVNAFELADPEKFRNEVVALVDVGFSNSTISILNNGELVLNRVVSVGGDKLTTGLAETLSISYEEAESIRIGMPMEVQSTLETLLLPLGRELRASSDFFEHQQEKPVSQVLVSGGCSCSEFLAQTLQSELMAPCGAWDPTASLAKKLPSEQLATLQESAPRLAVAVGAAAAVM